MTKIKSGFFFKNHEKKALKILMAFIIFILIIFKTQSIQNFKAFYLPETKYYIVTETNIFYYSAETGGNIYTYPFGNAQKINNVQESEMISFGIFKENLNIAYCLIVKNYFYALLDGNVRCCTMINLINGYVSQIYPYKCIIYDNQYNCFYILVFENSSKVLTFILNQNLVPSCDISSMNSITINIDSDSFSCQLMKLPSNEEVLTCFYQSSNEIKASSFRININIMFNIKNMEEISSLTNSKEITGLKIIKSALSQDGTKSFVCYINNDNNCECLIYDITNNIWSDNNIYLNDCLLESSSLHIEYSDNKNEYILYCFQSSTKFELQQFDSNFVEIEDEENGIYDLKHLLSDCTEYYLSSLVQNSNNLKMFASCDSNILQILIEEGKVIPPTIITTIFTFPATTILTTLPQTTIPQTTLPQTTLPQTTLPQTTLTQTTLNIISSKITLIPTNIANIPSKSSIIPFSQNDYEIIQENSKKTKEDIINNIENYIKNYDIHKIYEIFGNDYYIKISPINNKKYKNISTYIEFLSCENKLRDHYDISQNSILTVLQMEINKNNNNSLINQVEYIVYDEFKNILDLSVCSNELIKIYYNINNSSILNISYINYYNNIGIDIFNINDTFFNDICYPYSEGNSDMILKDRVNDIYQNYSLCDSNCEYENIDIQNMTITCNCFVKTEIEATIEEPTFKKIIFGIFEDSTFGVIKCYKLVFNLNKKDNIGFWMFLIFILLHIPFIINYIIYKERPIKKYIKEEMIKYHYIEKKNNPKKRKYKINIKNKDSIDNGLFSENNLLVFYQKKKIKGNNKVKNVENKLFKNSYSIPSSLKKLNLNIVEINKKTKNIESEKIKNKNKNKNKKRKKSKHKKKKSKNISTIKYFINSHFYINNNITYKTFSNFNHYIHLDTSNLVNNKYNNTFPNFSMKKKYVFLSKKNCICLLLYNMIKYDAYNILNKEYFSNYILYTDDYEEAIIYEKRSFFRIVSIMLILKEKIINTFCFKSPLELQSLRICLLIFIYSSNFALNTIFYFSDKISDKYHYKNNNLIIFTIINNLSISLISTLLSTIMITFLRVMTNSRYKMEKIFREQEKKMRLNKDYFVNKLEKKKIINKLVKIIKSLRIKITIFFIIELLLLLFFLYFTTAFCEVYKNTQIAWIADCLTSFILSIIIEILFSFIISILYIFSVKKKNKFIYSITSLAI